jgi:hypothetical protein
LSRQSLANETSRTNRVLAVDSTYEKVGAILHQRASKLAVIVSSRPNILSWRTEDHVHEYSSRHSVEF